MQVCSGCEVGSWFWYAESVRCGVGWYEVVEWGVRCRSWHASVEWGCEVWSGVVKCGVGWYVWYASLNSCCDLETFLLLELKRRSELQHQSDRRVLYTQM